MKIKTCSELKDLPFSVENAPRLRVIECTTNWWNKLNDSTKDRLKDLHSITWETLKGPRGRDQKWKSLFSLRSRGFCSELLCYHSFNLDFIFQLVSSKAWLIFKLVSQESYIIWFLYINCHCTFWFSVAACGSVYLTCFVRKI